MWVGVVIELFKYENDVVWTKMKFVVLICDVCVFKGLWPNGAWLIWLGFDYFGVDLCYFWCENDDYSQQERKEMEGCLVVWLAKK